MSSLDRKSSVRKIATGALMLALAATAACTVKPLYANRSGSTEVESSTRAVLQQITIKPAKTRVTQEVRNRLILLFGGGSGQPATGAYTMNLVVLSLVESGASVQSRGGEENEPTAGTVTLTGTYDITDSSGQVIVRGKRAITSSFDRPRQELASMRAELDATNRAARELAEVINLAVAQEMAGR